MANMLASINRTVRTDIDPSRAGEFFHYCRLLMRHPDDVFAALSASEHERAPARVVEVLRSAVAAGSTSSVSWAEALTPYRTLSDGFIASLASASVFDRLLADGAMKRVPLRTRIVVSTLVLTGSDVPEGMTKPIAAGALAVPAVEPRKSVCIIVLTDELVKLASSAAVALFNTELKNGVARATDATFINGLLAGVTPIASSGSTISAISVDLEALLGAMSMGAESRPYLVTTPTIARRLTLKAEGGVIAFPGMSLLSGGEIVSGLPVLISDQCPAGVVLGIDASGVVGDSAEVVVDASRYSVLDMAGPPNSPPSASANLVSLWPANQVALRAERYFGFSVARAGAVAALSGIAW